MKLSYLYTLLLLSLLAFSACEDVVDVELETGETLLVVQARITDSLMVQKVQLSTTAAYFSNQQTPRVSDAQVQITEYNENGEAVAVYPFVADESVPGDYTYGPWAGTIGYTYELEINWNNQQYESRTELKRIPEIDSLRVVERIDQYPFEDGKYVQMFFQEIPGKGDNMQLKFYKNDTLLNDGGNLAYFDDPLVDGNYIGNFDITFEPFELEDTVRVEMYSITREHITFFNEMIGQVNNGGLFANPPANVRGNVVNRDPSGPEALGFFACTGLRVKEIIVK